MKAMRVVLVIVVLSVVYTNTVFAQQTSITIDQIVEHGHVSGIVKGLEKKDYPQLKVIVYVHTDRWYIHPYANQDEGMSWASIKENGTWQIKTVKRDFKADKVAALLVRKSEPEQSKVEDEGFPQKIPHKAVTIKQLKGTPDHGKL